MVAELLPVIEFDAELYASLSHNELQSLVEWYQNDQCPVYVFRIPLMATQHFVYHYGKWDNYDITVAVMRFRHAPVVMHGPQTRKRSNCWLTMFFVTKGTQCCTLFLLHYDQANSPMARMSVYMCLQTRYPSMILSNPPFTNPD